MNFSRKQYVRDNKMRVLYSPPVVTKEVGDMNRIQLSDLQAQEIIDTHGIKSILESEEERDLLEENNPALLGAYITLTKIADNQ